MAASNYMTEADTESIWDTTLDTTRFGKIGVRMAEILNFWVNGDATSQVTNTAVTPILEQISEECLEELIAAAKENKVTDPWLFIQANVMGFMTKKLSQWRVILKKVSDKLETHHHIKFTSDLTFPSHSD